MVYHIISFYNDSINKTNITRDGITYIPYINPSIIPINSFYNLYMRPYHSNSPYIYQDFYNDYDFKMLESFQFKYKPISNYSHQIGRYYIPNKPIGNIVNNIIVPFKQSNLINPIQKQFTIEFIYTYSFIGNTSYNSNLHKYNSFEKTLYIHLKEKINSKKSIKSIEVVFIPYNINITDKYIITKWTPRYKLVILHTDYMEFDINEFNEPNMIKHYGEIYYTIID